MIRERQNDGDRMREIKEERQNDGGMIEERQVD